MSIELNLVGIPSSMLCGVVLMLSVVAKRPTLFSYPGLMVMFYKFHLIESTLNLASREG